MAELPLLYRMARTPTPGLSIAERAQWLTYAAHADISTGDNARPSAETMVRAMNSAERDELRALLDLDRRAGVEPDVWFDTRAAAEYLGVHHDTLRKLAAARVVPSEQDGPAASACGAHLDASAVACAIGV